MAIVYQPSLFSWKDVDDLGDLERLQLAIESMPDQALLAALKSFRAGGRNTHELESMWNSILAGVIFQHPSIESLRRELGRNAQLRQMCGFDPLKGSRAVPSKSAYNRFIQNLIKHEFLIDEMFNNLVKKLQIILPDFGKDLAFDSKSISSRAKATGKLANDHRGDHEADWGTKTYRGTNKDGTNWEKVKTWFGFKLHLVVDANYELPIAMRVTKASLHDTPVMKEMFVQIEKDHPEILESCEHGIGDKGYDDTALIIDLMAKYNIKAVVDIRNMWKDPDETRLLKSHQYKNVTHDFKGTVFCHCPQTGEIRKMVFGGFEKDRDALKYRCPALEYGLECKGAAECPIRKGIRVKLSEDYRIFTQVARSSYKWKRIYNKRSSVERVNSRMETSFGFDKHFIRGIAKMRVRCSLALCVMLSMALGRAKQNKYEQMRSLVKAA
jgi:hypothetical protein